MVGPIRWRRLLIVAAWAVLSASRSFGLDVRAGMVEFPGPRGPIRAYLARPSENAAYPPIVMIHERWGLTDWIKANADRVASWGYVVLAVDLYGGRVTDDPSVASAMARALDIPLAVDYLARGGRFLLAQPRIDARRKLGAIGWGMGGAMAREFAQATDLPGPIAICYGPVTTRAADVDRLVGKPILGIFGALDNTVLSDEVRRFGAMLADRGTRFNFKIFPRAAHNFMRPDNPDFSPADAQPAWVAIEEFFSVYLHGEP